MNFTLFKTLGKPVDRRSPLTGWSMWLKHTLAAVNLMAILTGVFLLIGSTVFLSKISFIQQLIGTDYYAPLVVFVVILACALVILGYLGYVGAAHDLRYLFIAYSFLMLIGLICFTVACLLFSTSLGTTVAVIRGRLHSTFASSSAENTTTRNAWDHLQRKMSCCGVDGSPDDWPLLHKRFMDIHNNTVPLSCCKLTYLGATFPCQDSPSGENTNLHGCLKKVIARFDSSTNMLCNLVTALSTLVVICALMSYRLFAILSAPPPFADFNPDCTRKFDMYGMPYDQSYFQYQY